MSLMVEVSITPETISHIGPLPVTNTLLTAWLVIIILIAGAVIFSRRIKKIPGKLQNFVEFIIESVLDFMETVAGDRHTALRFFPIVATLFIFILFSNWDRIAKLEFLRWPPPFLP